MREDPGAAPEPPEPDTAAHLMALADQDLAVRAKLAAAGLLSDGYHPEMAAVHAHNAAQLEAVIHRIGWPTAARVGAQAADAAWLIAQHAIGAPDLQRRCARAMATAADCGELPAWQPAMLEDRIATMEGRPQRYGTAFDWDETGRLSPCPIEPGDIDARRAAVGLGPLADAVAAQRAAALPPPRDLAARNAAMQAWLRETGWR